VSILITCAAHHNLCDFINFTIFFFLIRISNSSFVFILHNAVSIMDAKLGLFHKQKSTYQRYYAAGWSGEYLDQTGRNGRVEKLHNTQLRKFCR
jgi:hypothetical protein